MANDIISTEYDRRVLSHLSIPRNIDDLAAVLRTDVGFVHSADPRDDDGLPVQRVNAEKVYRTLEELKGNGHVVNLGGHNDPAKLAAKVESSKARTMPDEKAEIYSRRRADRPQDAWMMQGDLWMMTDEGRDASRAATQENVPPPMTTSQLRSTIESEWARVKANAPLKGSIFDEDGGRLPEDYGEALAGALLRQEFDYWLDAVLEEHARVWGEGEAKELRRSLPMGGGSQFSDAYEIILVDAWNQKASITAAAPWHMALVETTAVTDADTGSTLDEPGYTGYARKTVGAADMSAGSGSSGSVSNANAIIFAACTAGTNTVIGFAHCVAATVGVMRSYGTCSSTVISPTQTPAQFAAGQYSTTVA